MKKINVKDLSEPDLSFSGFKMWIFGRQFPESSDSFDGNWLVAGAFCESIGSQTWVQGPIIHLSEIHQWLTELRNLHSTIQGEAALHCMEPYLKAKVALDKLGNGTLVVSITPDHLKEIHEFTFEVDQSYLPAVIRDLKDIIDKYPIKGNKLKALYHKVIKKFEYY
jgi:hypothetical protein